MHVLARQCQGHKAARQPPAQVLQPRAPQGTSSSASSVPSSPELAFGCPSSGGGLPSHCFPAQELHLHVDVTHNTTKRDPFALPPLPALGPAPPLLQLSKVAAPLPAPSYGNQDCPLESSRSLRFPVLTPSRQIHPVRRSPPLEALPDHSSWAPRPAQNPTQKGSQEWTRLRGRIQVCTQPASSQASPLLY